MSWAAVAASAISAGVGIYQTHKAKKLADQAGERPDYEIPESVKSALGTAQLKSLQGVPGAVKSQMLQEMDRSRMASLRQVNERRGGLGVVSQLEQKQQDAIRQMGIMDIQQREKNVQGLQEMRLKMAGFEDKQFAHELAGWEQKSEAAAAMKGAGMQNIAGAVTSVATAAASGAFKGAGGTDSNMFTGKKREAFKLSGGKEGTGMSFREYKQADVGFGGYTDFIQSNPNFIQNRQEMRRTGETSQPKYTIPERPVIETSNKIDASPIQETANTSESTEGVFTSLNDPLYQMKNQLGYEGGYGYNSGMYSNIGLSSAIDAYGDNPSLQRQLWGTRTYGG